MNETDALRQLQAEWAEALDEGHHQEQERLLDLGWHVGPVYTLHLDRKPLVALKYMDTAVVWIKPSSLLRALDRIVDSRDPEEAEEEVPWYDLGDNCFVLEVCDCGYPECGSTLGELHIMDGDLYIGLVADARGGRLHLTYPQYASPFPIRLPLERFYAEYTETVRLLSEYAETVRFLFAQGGGDLREEDDVLPSPLVDGWVVQLEPGGRTWRSEKWLTWEKDSGFRQPPSPERKLKDKLLWEEVLKYEAELARGDRPE